MPNSVVALAISERWISPFLEPGSIMSNALVAGLLVVFTTSIIGTWVVLRGLSFLGDALAHGVLPGVVMAFILGANTSIGAFLAAAVMVLLMSAIRDRSPLPDDTSIGIVFVGFLALAVVLLSAQSSEYVGDLDRFLFGSIVSVSNEDFVRQLGAAIVVLIGVAIFYRSLLATTFDPLGAKLLGFSPKVSHLVLMLLLAIAVVASFDVVGNLLVFAFLVAPPATAALLARRIPTIMGLSVLIGAVAVWVGLVAADYYGAAPAATIALVTVTTHLAVVLLRSVRPISITTR